MLIITTAILLFLLAAFFGFFVLMAILKNKNTPGPLVFVHGILAVFGIFAIIAYTFVNPNTLLIIAVTVLIIAALGGFTLLTIDMSKKPIPKLFAIAHPFLAGLGVLMVIIYFYHKYLQT